MEDNGIISFYKKEYYNHNGFLDLSSLKYLKRNQNNENVYKTKINGNSFYLKQPRFNNEIDAEVMLGQVYNKAGIDNAVYTPVFFKNEFGKKISGVISNDVCSDNGEHVLARKYYEELCFRKFIYAYDLVPNHNWHKEDLVLQFFDKKALRELTLLHALDVASFNMDRADRNFYFKLDNGKATGVTSIDNGLTFQYLLNEAINPKDFNDESKWPRGLRFYSHIGDTECKTRTELIEELKTNETVAKLITPTEMAETIGSVNIPKIAEDIKDTIGFEVDKHCVEVLDASFYNMAEELSK